MSSMGWRIFVSTLSLTHDHLDSVFSKHDTLPMDFMARGTPWHLTKISYPISISLGLLVSCPFLNAICSNKDQDSSSERPLRVYIETGLVISATNLTCVVIIILLPFAPPIKRRFNSSHLLWLSFHTSSKTSKYPFLIKIFTKMLLQLIYMKVFWLLTSSRSNYFFSNNFQLKRIRDTPTFLAQKVYWRSRHCIQIEQVWSFLTHQFPLWE